MQRFLYQTFTRYFHFRNLTVIPKSEIKDYEKLLNYKSSYNKNVYDIEISRNNIKIFELYVYIKPV